MKGGCGGWRERERVTQVEKEEFFKMIRENDSSSLLQNMEEGTIIRTKQSSANESSWRHFTGPIVSNAICILFAVGSAIVLLVMNFEPESVQHIVLRYTFSCGLYGVLAGLSNWLALRMLFVRIPFLYGSGVIPRRFKPIREALKETIMRVFFDAKFLEKYAAQKLGRLGAELQLDHKLQSLINSDEMTKIIDSKILEVSGRPEGLILTMNGFSDEKIRKLIKPFLLGMSYEVAPLLFALVDPAKQMNLEKIRGELDNLLSEKLMEITPEVLKSFIEDVIWAHLGWIIIWGNIFGIVSGAVAETLTYKDFLL